MYLILFLMPITQTDLVLHIRILPDLSNLSSSYNCSAPLHLKDSLLKSSFRILAYSTVSYQLINSSFTSIMFCIITFYFKSLVYVFLLLFILTAILVILALFFVCIDGFIQTAYVDYVFLLLG